MDIKMLNEKLLNEMKYTQLQKLAAKCNIKARWARKEDLIKNLISFRRQSHSTPEETDNRLNEELWLDGSEIKNILPPPVEQALTRGTFTVEKLKDSRATYDLTSVINDILPSLDKPGTSRLTFDIPKKKSPPRGKVKMLTIPYSPVKSSLVQTKRRPGLKIKPQTKVPLQKENLPKQTAGPSTSRRKSKSDDPTTRRSLGVSLAATFRTPQEKKSQNSTKSKPFTATKLPDFASIHEKQFQKMDSLDVYISKKAERVKNLFGTPMVQRPLERAKRQGASNPAEIKEDIKCRRQLITKPTPMKNSLLEARKMFNKNPIIRTQTDVKDKNRSHIHGIRTNKRFELQMKFRNM